MSVATGFLQFLIRPGFRSMFRIRVLIEKWASKEALDAHDLAPHMLEAAKHNPTFRAGPATVLFLESAVLSSH